MSRRKPVLLIILLILSLLLNAYLILIKVKPDLEIHFKVRQDNFVGTWQSGNREVIIRDDDTVYITQTPLNTSQRGYELLLKGKIVDNVLVIDRIFNDEAYYKKNGKYYQRDIPVYLISNECYDSETPINIRIEKTSKNTITIEDESFVRKEQ
jgi:hypothetical protein